MIEWCCRFCAVQDVYDFARRHFSHEDDPISKVGRVAEGFDMSIVACFMVEVTTADVLTLYNPGFRI